MFIFHGRYYILNILKDNRIRAIGLQVPQGIKVVFQIKEQYCFKHRILVLKIGEFGFTLLAFSFSPKSSIFFQASQSSYLLPSGSWHCLKMLLGNGRAAENKLNKILTSMYFSWHLNFKGRNCFGFCLLSLFQLLCL